MNLHPGDASFIIFPIPPQLPDNGLSQLANRLLLFRHDYNSPKVLQLVNAASEIIDDTLVEIVLTANCELLSWALCLSDKS